MLSKKSFSYRYQSLLTKGQQTLGNFFLQKAESISEIEKIIRSEIDNYRLRFQNAREGFLVNWPTRYTLNGWLVYMNSGGALAPHMHEQGWISGAVYINVPVKTKPNAGNFAVCYDDQIPEEDDQQNPHKIIDVFTGSLVLFPASLMHYTIPFESDEKRMVLAFDVMPV